jgi:hypothetical protein
MYSTKDRLDLLMDVSIKDTDGSQEAAVRLFMNSVNCGIDSDDDELLLDELGENDEERQQAAVALWCKRAL